MLIKPFYLCNHYASTGFQMDTDSLFHYPPGFFFRNVFVLVEYLAVYSRDIRK